MSETSLVAARFVHYASTIALAGCLCFATLIAPRGFVDPLWRRIAQTALPIVVLSGALWFAMQAVRMSERSIADALRPATLSAVLWHTQFGAVFAIRLGLCALLALGLWRRRRSVPSIALVLSALLLASLAWVGHAVDEEGRDYFIHLVADIAHLLAAGAWLGGLPMLALLLHRGPTIAPADSFDLARAATQRFSAMGLTAVGTLLVTGIVNTWFLAGSSAALIGTDYGRWLLVKIALFVAMVATAAVNRRVLTPRLALTSSEPDRATARVAWVKLRRNSLIEAALGLGVIAIVAWLGSAVPGAHQQAVWPLPVRFGVTAHSMPALSARPSLAVVAVVMGLIFAAAALMLRRWKLRLAAVVVVVIAFLLPRCSVLVTAAHPTTFFNSPTGYTAHSVAVGAHAFAQNCAMCHGQDGKGDGPLAKSLPIPPANLTAAHIYGHLPGDLYWTIEKGIPGTPMPGFGHTLDAQTRWSLIDFILANADAARARLGTPVQVPDFAIECQDGVETSLRASAGHIVVLVFDVSGVAAQIAAQIGRGLGPDVMTVFATDTRPRSDTCNAPAADLAAVLALYLPDRAQRAPVSEFLIDGKGWLRNAWPSVPDVATLRRAIAIARTIPVTVPARPTGHVH